MRLREFALDDVIEDEAESRGDAELITTLEFLRNQSAGKHLVPRVKATSLINMVNRQGDGANFTHSSLMDAFKTNSVVKNLIADIKDDETGEKYVYLQSADDESGQGTDAGTSNSEPGKIVSKMADKAVANRS